MKTINHAVHECSHRYGYNNNDSFFLSFSERGRVFIRNEVWAFQIGPSGLVFTGDGKGELKVWIWASQIP